MESSRATGSRPAPEAPRDAAMASVPDATATTTHLPRPITIHGSGPSAAGFWAPVDGPMIVTAVHTGASTFILDGVPRDTEVATTILNEIGPYAGQVLCSCRPGAHELQVVADGRWTVRLTVPISTAAAIDLPESLAGRGSRVIVVASRTERRMHVTTTHLGTSNVIVALTGFGDTEGSELLTNDIGLVHDVTVVDVPPGRVPPADRSGRRVGGVLRCGRWSTARRARTRWHRQSEPPLEVIPSSDAERP